MNKSLTPNRVTRYIVRFNRGQHANRWLATFAIADWSFTTTEKESEALAFVSMTLALSVAVCCMIDQEIEVVPVLSQQEKLAFTVDA